MPGSARQRIWALLSEHAVFEIYNAYDQLEIVSGQEERISALYQGIRDSLKRQKILYQIHILIVFKYTNVPHLLPMLVGISLDRVTKMSRNVNSDILPRR